MATTFGLGAESSRLPACLLCFQLWNPEYLLAVSVACHRRSTLVVSHQPNKSTRDSRWVRVWRFCQFWNVCLYPYYHLVICSLHMLFKTVKTRLQWTEVKVSRLLEGLVSCTLLCIKDDTFLNCHIMHRRAFLLYPCHSCQIRKSFSASRRHLCTCQWSRGFDRFHCPFSLESAVAMNVWRARFADVGTA